MIGLCVAVKAAEAHRPGLHKAGTLEAPLHHWLVSARQRTNAVLEDRCRPRPFRQIRPARLVPEYLRRFTIGVELGRWLRALETSSACKPWPSSWEHAALCVHSHEGAWNANTGNGYYGGMQMDYSFQRTYGPEFLSRYGTANNWTPFQQLLASWRAYQTRGWTPWPNTARMCGLL